ncbi:outer membrane beta-barrel protein [Novosphingobium resinovorum]|uniref:outer membrane beta-barrel protein n=1 Tax=Novosphingobium resinovorum TaxID=158500 RepID=UPI002ED2C1C0|nr:outer membrane beta-barrel protein [Novosphingobium resinovorum]
MRRKAVRLSGRSRPDAALVPCLLGVICANAVTPGAQAQDMAGSDTAISVQKRARPELDPVPIRFGGFETLASIDSRLAYDDNIYATRGARVDDALASLSAAVSARSTWTRHAFSLDVDAALTRGLSQDDEDTETYGARLGGRLDLGAQSRVSARAGYARAYEPRGSIGDTTLRGPRIAYDTLDLGIEAQHTAGRLTVEAQAGLDSYRYAPYRVADTRIARSDRDYRSWNASLSAGYAFVPGVAAFAEGSYNAARYPGDTSGLDRSSQGWALQGGLAFGVTRLIRGRAAIGYQDQRYDDPAFPRIKGLDFNAGIEWSPTRLMTWTLEARRTIQRSPLAGVAGIRQSRFGARLDYEVRRNLIVWARADHTVGEYSGTERSQKDLAGGLGADWLLGRKLRISAQAGAQRTRSDDPGGRAFDRRRISVAVRYAL